MGDFERTFGAGADAASIIDAYSDQEEDIDSAQEKDSTTSEERLAKAKQRGVNISWRSRIDVYPDAVDPSVLTQPDFLAFDKFSDKNVGRVFRIHRNDDSPFFNELMGRWIYPEKWEVWGWSMYAHSTTKRVPFRTYGATSSLAEAESFMAEAYGLLLEHNRPPPRFSFFVNLSNLGSDHLSIWTQDGGCDLEIETDSESDAVIGAHTWGHTLYVVINCGPSGNFGSVHPDIGNAIAAFSAQFDGWHDNDVPIRSSCEPKISRAVAEILAAHDSGQFTSGCFRTISCADTEITIAAVLMYGYA
ncbi:hypothetical protein [Microvirga tunisiensis]|uniref:Uncharacterized protein n=1 Tax=Microvirga tunisiensis TaxID=2108360 RepID=A0A5N7MCR6_9HYPH|nr:hypothetical protein [Microvirga tunisiensis]MPR06273.1 hypothetical protein [Microvirga tunisiensis]MPR24059.1 hypothetical protein [Microvirga tunisiensis]